MKKIIKIKCIGTSGYINEIDLEDYSVAYYSFENPQQYCGLTS